MVSRTIFMSGRLAPSTAKPIGTPWPSTNRLRLTPLLARSVGFLPVFFPPESCLGHAPVHAQPVPVEALQAVIFEQPRLPECQEDAVFDPLLEAVVGRGPRAELGGIERLPLAAGAEDEEDGIQAHPIRCARPAAAEAVRVPMDGEVHGDLLPQVIGDAPVVGCRRFVHDSTGGKRSANRATSAAVGSCHSFSGVIRIGSYFDEVNGRVWHSLWPADAPRVFFGHIPEEDGPELPHVVSLDAGCVFGGAL